MNLLEALVALMMAAGVIAAGLEASYQAQARTALARLETEAVVRAEALLARTGAEIPLQTGHFDGADGNSVRWALDIQRDESVKGPPYGFQVTADVVVTRDEGLVRQKLVTLKVGSR